MKTEDKLIIIIALGIIILFILSWIILPNLKPELYKNDFNKSIDSKKFINETQEKPINYIQSSHTKIDYSISTWNNELKIQNIISCDELTGSSMQPTIFTGNVVCFKKFLSREQLHEGDIIEYKDWDGVIFIHRVKAIYDTYVLTQGDNNKYAEQVDYENIKSIVVGILFT